MAEAVPFRRRLRGVAAELLRQAVKVSWDLLKIMVPISIAVRVLQELGVVALLGRLLSPVMSVVGLPGEMGLVWATAMVANIYGGLAVFAQVAPGLGLTVAQLSVLAAMILVAHTLPIELRIAQKAGPRLRFMGTLRFGGALVLGFILHRVYAAWGLLAMPPRMHLPAAAADTGWWRWAIGQGRLIGYIFCVILGLLVLMRLLKWLGVTALLCRALAPVLRVLGMSGQAAPITIIGMVLGLNFGGGLIIQQARSGGLSKRDVFYSLALMGLAHSLIEDTLLMTALGAHWSATLLGRVVFAAVVVFLLVRVLSLVSDRTFDRMFFRPPRAAPKAATAAAEEPRTARTKKQSEVRTKRPSSQ